jgi:methylenetetrahydrofolate reductase (NADPH)
MSVVSSLARATPARRTALARALREASYEVLPLRGTEDKVLADVPREVALTVTTTSARGLEPTVQLAERLAGHGYPVAPHLAARLVRDRSHLADLVARLRAGGVDRAFVIGGDAPDPVGTYVDALGLLRDLAELDHPFASIGIAGHPEGHGEVPEQLMEQALVDKAPYADEIVTQICFDAGATTSWATGVRARGVELPVRVGIPGAVDRQKLVRIAAGLGLGPSARFLTKQRSLFWRFFRPGGYRPDRLIERLIPQLGSPAHGLVGFHVFTFNELAGTEAWRRAWLEALA